MNEDTTSQLMPGGPLNAMSQPSEDGLTPAEQSARAWILLALQKGCIVAVPFANMREGTQTMGVPSMGAMNIAQGVWGRRPLK